MPQDTAREGITPIDKCSKIVGLQQEPNLYDVLTALGHSPRGRVSLNFKSQDRFTSRLLSVRDLRSWSLPTDRDVWFGILPVSASVHRGRGTDADITRASALWADLDIKDGCLGSLAECYRVVQLLADWLGTQPTALIETGHGLQPYWRLRNTHAQPNRIAEHWPHGSAGDLSGRERWKAFYARWGGLVALAVHQIRPGASADPVFDLPRVLRCPGSVNRKQLDRLVPVRTTLTPGALGVTRQRVVNVVAAHGVVVAAPAPMMASVPTAPREARVWLQSQPGSDVDWYAMSPGLQRLVLYPDLLQLFSKGTADETSAHALMNKRVLAVILTATEGSAGVSLALEMIRAAYLETMELRRSGTLAGEARSAAVALSDFFRAMTGAVAKARGRSVVAPMRDADGSVVLRTDRVSTR